MIKYPPEAMKKLDEIVRCEHCGKQIRRGQSIFGFREIVCRECAMKIADFAARKTDGGAE